MPLRSRARVGRLVLLALLVGNLALGDAVVAQERGRVVEGPGNISSFRPSERSTDVDLERLSLKTVFEEIGENGALWYQHVQTLANPYFEGRVNGSDGTTRARDYLAFYFEQYGLEPPFPGGYLQPFTFSARRRSLAAANVGGVLPGRGDLADEWLVIGGHYDHNGYGRFGTEPEDGPLYPGGDDNASGTAGILVLAKMLTEAYAASDRGDLRSVLFIAFDAEERGLHGSRYFSTHPIMEPASITALLNMDMIGRLRSNTLSVLGVGTAVGLRDVLRPHFLAGGMTIAATDAGSGRSDDANFEAIEVPALHFFTGMHPEYTTPQDHAWTVNPVGGAKIVDLLYSIAIDLVTRPDRLVHPARAERLARRAPAARGDAPPAGQRGVRLGIRPAAGSPVGTTPTGVTVAAVTEGSNADRAGIRAGDILLRWNRTDLDGVPTLVEVLAGATPGSVVAVTVLRDGARLVVPVRLRAGG